MVGVSGIVSTHSRPKAAGQALGSGVLQGDVSTHSRPKAAGLTSYLSEGKRPFQHTAARRRLVDNAKIASRRSRVSTHSRPKADG